MIPRTELDRYFRARFAAKTAQLRSELPGQENSPVRAPVTAAGKISREPLPAAHPSQERV